MTSFDLFIISILALSVAIAWIRGLSRELVTLVAIAIGALAIFLLGGPFSSMFGSGTFGPIIGVTVLFLIAFAIASVVLEIFVSHTWGKEPRRVDQISGAVFGLIRGWFLVGLAYLALTYYFEEGEMPEPIENAALKGIVTSASGILEHMGLEKETSGDESPDTLLAE